MATIRSLDSRTTWSWDSSDCYANKGTPDKENGDDGDSDLAWRLQLEALRDDPTDHGWGDIGELVVEMEDEHGDAELALMQQVAEIERAEWEVEARRHERCGGIATASSSSSLPACSNTTDRRPHKSSSNNGIDGSKHDKQADGTARAKRTRVASISKPRRSAGSTRRGDGSKCPESESRPTAEAASDSTPGGVCAVCSGAPPAASSVASSSLCTPGHSTCGLATLPCGHTYCTLCLGKLFRSAIDNTSLFPPRCCGVQLSLDGGDDDAAPLSTATNDPCGGGIRPEVGEGQPARSQGRVAGGSTGVRKWLDSETVAAFEQRRRQLTSEVVAKRAATTTAAASGTVTDVDEDFLRTAAACGWARCCGCGRFVELEFGCNHMVCRCGAHFCYACGKPWKTCECAQWTEDRLLVGTSDPMTVERAEHAGQHQNDGEADVRDIAHGNRNTDVHPRRAVQTSTTQNTARQGAREARQQRRQQWRRHQQQQQQCNRPTESPPLPHQPRAATSSVSTITLAQPVPPPLPPITTIPENADDPPPPYPGPPLPGPPLVPAMAPFLHNDPDTPSLTNTEYARLHSIRAVFDELNAVLSALDGTMEANPYPIQRPGAPLDGRRPGEVEDCTHAKWVVPGGGQRDQMLRCDVCAWHYGFDIWYRCGGEDERDSSGGGGGIMMCDGCEVRACWFCRDNRL